MPQSPAADPAQKSVLTSLVSLSSNSAVAAGNQIALVSDQSAKYQNAQDIFQKRYDYWNTYILAYHAERKSLNGVFQENPIANQDFTDFMAQKGRLFKAQILNPIRIHEFDNVTGATTATEAQNELTFLAEESVYRGFLTGGFVGTSLPVPGSGGYSLITAISPGTTQITLQTIAAVSFPVSGRLMFFNTGSPTAGVIVEWLTVTASASGPDFNYTLKGLTYSPTFTTISSGSSIGQGGPTFTNGERTTKIATLPTNQSQLNAYINAYLYWIQKWSANVASQVTQIAAQATAGEDQPDTAYGTSIQSTSTALINYLTTNDVSNTGLGANSTRNSTRTSQNPTRITWIDARLIQQTQAYDQRYNYADKLYNLADGSVVTINKINGQKTGLATQQAASNARAASLSGEVF